MTRSFFNAKKKSFVLAKKGPQKFSVILPCYNEGEHIKDFLQELLTFFANENIEAEFICINDASSDETHAQLENFKKNHDDIIILSFKENKGQGAAFREGLKLASGDYVFWIPSDGEIPPTTLKPLLKVARLDSVIVNYPTNGRQKRPLGRFLISRLYQIILGFMFGLKLKYFNGTAIYPRPLIENISFYSDRFFFPAELLIRTHLNTKAHFLEIPFELKKRQSGKSKAFQVKVFWDILKNGTRLLRDQKKLKTKSSCRLHF